MVGTQIPNLVLAHSEPNESDPTTFGEHIIAKDFKSIFKFRDGDKTWSAYFKIKITETGTPKLLSVEVTGNKAKHPKPISRTYTRENRHEMLPGGGVFVSKAEMDEYARLDPEPESVERWQLKFVEQYRFQLFQLGIRLAVELGHLETLKDPDGVPHQVYMPKKLEESEIKKLLKEIDKKIRQKITPDFLQEVAKIYTEAAIRGEKPIKAVQESYNCSYRTAQDYAIKAREIGLLPETSPGKVTVVAPKKARNTTTNRTTVRKEKK